MQKILIVGGGFAGVKAARELAQYPRKFKVTLVSDRTCFEYHADLYRSATGRSVLEADVPLADIFGSTAVEVVTDKITAVGMLKKQAKGESGSTYRFDKILLAIGGMPNYYGIQGIQEHSFSIRSINEALKFKNHLHQELGQKADLNYVVVGGGPAGVELAAELVFYLQKLRKKHNIHAPFKVILVEAAPRLLPMLPEDMSQKIQQRLQQIGVKVYTSTAVKAESAGKLALPEGDISTHTVVWTAGVKNHELFSRIIGLKFEKNGRVKVNDRLEAAPDVYVLGDNAATAHSGLASTAIYDGQFVARNLIREAEGKPPKAYRLPAAITAIPVGGKWAAVLKKHRRYYGKTGWTVRRHADYHLYSSVLPPSLAFKTWLFGNRIEESCPICKN